MQRQIERAVDWRYQHLVNVRCSLHYQHTECGRRYFTLNALNKLQTYICTY